LFEKGPLRQGVFRPLEPLPWAQFLLEPTSTTASPSRNILGGGSLL
jgi:hypothetical protein